MAISEGSWDGSASRFSDSQYEASCVLDRKSCGGDWASKPPKERCSLPIREPNGDLSRAGVHAAAGRIGSVKNVCSGAIASAKSALRDAYKTLGEKPPPDLARAIEWSDAEVERFDAGSMPGTRIGADHVLASFTEGDLCRFEERTNERGLLGVVHGHFAVFNRFTEIDSPYEGHFLERMAPGAFTKTFKENKSIKAIFQHGKDPSIGLKPLGPVRDLHQDDTGAAYEFGLLDTPYNRDLYPGLQLGLFGSSFRFGIVREDQVLRPGRSSENPKGLPTSTILEAKVREFGPVTFPAYADADASLRSLDDELRGMDLRLFAATEPKVAARFVQYFANNPLASDEEATASVGSEPARSEDAPEEVERNAPTAEDYGIIHTLRGVKMEIANLKAKQLHDPDNKTDPDDHAVWAAIEKMDAACDEAIAAQSKDSHPDPGSAQSSAEQIAYRSDEPSADTVTREEQSTDTEERTSVSAPAERAPELARRNAHPGATLKKRAAPLRNHGNSGGKPPWRI